MDEGSLLAVNDTILWLKVSITAATILLLCLRYRRGKKTHAAPSYSPGAKAIVVLAVLFSFAVFHNLGTMRGGTFIHVADMFHYYLGSKYFKELGHFELYNAVLVADTEQGNQLARQPWYTDLRTYQNSQRAVALEQSERVRGLFSDERWAEFKDDVAFFKTATGMPQSPGLMFLLMDHGYNGSPVSTSMLGLIASIVPVTQLHLLASLDVVLVIAMGLVVFSAFGFEMGALFSVFFCVNYLNPYDYISGGFLRYDWFTYLIVAVCLLHKRRYAGSAFFFTLSAMIRVFPAVLFFGMAVLIVKNLRKTRAIEAKHKRFVLTAGVTAAVLFVLPSVFLGSVVPPWQEFVERLSIHDNGVYVNHIGLRGIALFEPSHLSLEEFVEAYKSDTSPDIVRNWQDAKEYEYQYKKPGIMITALLVLAALAVIIWKRESEIEAMLWPLFFVYAASFPSHYYYVFLSAFILLFFTRPNALHALVPLCLLLVANIGFMVTDYFRPSPIVFYTVVNLGLFVALLAIFAFELYATALGRLPMPVAVSSGRLPDAKPRRQKRRK